MKLSLVVPLYNDHSLAQDFCAETQRVFETYFKTRDLKPLLEVLFVDDGSKQINKDHLQELTQQFPFVKIIYLSRNFGQHIALSAGYKYAKGEYVGMLNVDMEDPPDQIPVLLEKMRETSCDIIHGLYSERNVSFMNKLSSHFFGFLLNRLTGANAPLNASTLRIMNRKFTDAYNRLTEKHRYIPGLEIWLGFHHEYVPIRHQPRKTGRSSYSFWGRLKMAVSAILSFSDLPLKITSILGVLFACSGILMAGILALKKILGFSYQPGYTSTVTLIVFSAGVQIFVTGLAGIYIGRVLREVQGRPVFLVKDTVNIGQINESV